MADGLSILALRHCWRQEARNKWLGQIAGRVKNAPAGVSESARAIQSVYGGPSRDMHRRLNSQHAVHGVVAGSIKNLVLTMPIRFWLVILVIVVAIAWALTKMILS